MSSISVEKECLGKQGKVPVRQKEIKYNHIIKFNNSFYNIGNDLTLNPTPKGEGL